MLQRFDSLFILILEQRFMLISNHNMYFLCKIIILHFLLPGLIKKD